MTWLFWARIPFLVILLVVALGFLYVNVTRFRE